MRLYNPNLININIYIYIYIYGSDHPIRKYIYIIRPKHGTYMHLHHCPCNHHGDNLDCYTRQ